MAKKTASTRGGNATTNTLFFEPSRLAGLEAMRFTTKRRIDGSYTGRHAARRLGGAGQFVDAREYTPGDDLRRIDWPAMARTGRAYLKLFQDETNLACTLLLDASGSMQFGDTVGLAGGDLRAEPLGKFAWTRYFASTMAHLIVLGRDQVSLGMASGAEPSALIPPGATAGHVRLMQEAIANARCDGPTYLSESLNDVFMRVRRRGVLLVVSDFLVETLDPVVAALRLFRSRGWETVALHIVHPDELRLPEGVAFRFTGLEGELAVNCRPAEIRQQYERRFASHLEVVRGGLLAAGCDYRRFLTSTDYLQAVRSFFVPKRG